MPGTVFWPHKAIKLWWTNKRNPSMDLSMSVNLRPIMTAAFDFNLITSEHDDIYYRESYSMFLQEYDWQESWHIVAIYWVTRTEGLNHIFELFAWLQSKIFLQIVTRRTRWYEPLSLFPGSMQDTILNDRKLIRDSFSGLIKLLLLEFGILNGAMVFFPSAIGVSEALLPLAACTHPSIFSNCWQEDLFQFNFWWSAYLHTPALNASILKMSFRARLSPGNCH